MFDFVRNKKWLVQAILGAIVVTFAFFGIDAYFRDGGTGSAIATVGDQRISQAEFGEALRRQQEQVRELLGNEATASVIDGPEIRAMVLDRLIQQRLLVEQASREGVLIPDADLQKLLLDIPAFRDGERFSLAKYEEFLKSRRRTAVQFESELRGDLMAQRLSDAYAGTAIVPAAIVERLARLREQKREVRWSVITPEQFLDRVTLAPDAAQQYYDAHQAEFRIPEKARVQYIVLSPDALSKQVTVSDEEIRAVLRAEPRPVPEIRRATGEPYPHQRGQVGIGGDQGGGQGEGGSALRTVEAQARDVRRGGEGQLAGSGFCDQGR